MFILPVILTRHINALNAKRYGLTIKNAQIKKRKTSFIEKILLIIKSKKFKRGPKRKIKQRTGKEVIKIFSSSLYI
jgi:hypothetical protein